MPPATEPADLFDPRHYAAVRRPRETAETLPAWCYTSQAFYERERNEIFFKYWNCIGHQNQVPKPGSYITLRFLDVPIVVMRGEDMKVRAFINSCSHRASEVALGSGECKFLKCPYHAWAFSLTGELIGTPLYDESETFRKADHGLRPVKLEIWAGLMWINLNPDSADLKTYLGDLPERVAPWGADDMVCVSRVVNKIEANWKHYFENYSDSYHVPFVHQSSLNWKRVRGRELHDPAIYKGNYIMHAAWFDGTRGVRNGEKAFPQLPTPPALHGSFFPYVYPNAGLQFHNDFVALTEVYPDGPDRFIHVRSFMIPEAFTALPDYEEIRDNYLRNQQTVGLEDFAVLEAQQRSAHSPFYKPGRFAHMDRLVHDCQLWILDHVIGNSAAPIAERDEETQTESAVLRRSVDLVSGDA